MRLTIKFGFVIFALFLLVYALPTDLPTYSDMVNIEGAIDPAVMEVQLIDDCLICLDFTKSNETLMFPSETNKPQYDVKLVYRGTDKDGFELRNPVEYAAIIVYANRSDSPKVDLYRIYTDDKGVAIFNFSKYTETPGECIDFVFGFCPSYSGCGFQDCLTGMGVKDSTPYTWIENLEDGPPPNLGKPASPPKPAPYTLKPITATATYCVPPKENSLGMPGFCFPLMLIFALLGGALYLSGRNPLGGFDLSTPRLHKPYQYSARTRSITFSMQSAIGLVGSIAGAAAAGKIAEKVGAISEKSAAGLKEDGAEGAKGADKAGPKGPETKGQPASNQPAGAGNKPAQNKTPQVNQTQMVGGKPVAAGNKMGLPNIDGMNKSWGNFMGALKDSYGQKDEKGNSIAPSYKGLGDQIGKAVGNAIPIFSPLLNKDKGTSWGTAFLQFSYMFLSSTSIGSFFAAYDSAARELKGYGLIDIMKDNRGLSDVLALLNSAKEGVVVKGDDGKYYRLRLDPTSGKIVVEKATSLDAKGNPIFTGKAVGTFGYNMDGLKSALGNYNISAQQVLARFDEAADKLRKAQAGEKFAENRTFVIEKINGKFALVDKETKRVIIADVTEGGEVRGADGRIYVLKKYESGSNVSSLSYGIPTNEVQVSKFTATDKKGKKLEVGIGYLFLNKGTGETELFTFYDKKTGLVAGTNLFSGETFQAQVIYTSRYDPSTNRAIVTREGDTNTYVYGSNGLILASAPAPKEGDNIRGKDGNMYTVIKLGENLVYQNDQTGRYIYQKDFKAAPIIGVADSTVAAIGVKYDSAIRTNDLLTLGQVVASRTVIDPNTAPREIQAELGALPLKAGGERMVTDNRGNQYVIAADETGKQSISTIAYSRFMYDQPEQTSSRAGEGMKAETTFAIKGNDGSTYFTRQDPVTKDFVLDKATSTGLEHAETVPADVTKKLADFNADYEKFKAGPIPQAQPSGAPVVGVPGSGAGVEVANAAAYQAMKLTLDAAPPEIRKAAEDYMKQHADRVEKYSEGEKIQDAKGNEYVIKYDPDAAALVLLGSDGHRVPVGSSDVPQEVRDAYFASKPYDSIAGISVQGSDGREYTIRPTAVSSTQPEIQVLPPPPPPSGALGTASLVGTTTAGAQVEITPAYRAAMVNLAPDEVKERKQQLDNNREIYASGKTFTVRGDEFTIKYDNQTDTVSIYMNGERIENTGSVPAKVRTEYVAALAATVTPTTEFFQENGSKYLLIPVTGSNKVAVEWVPPPPSATPIGIAAADAASHSGSNIVDIITAPENVRKAYVKLHETVLDAVSMMAVLAPQTQNAMNVLALKFRESINLEAEPVKKFIKDRFEDSLGTGDYETAIAYAAALDMGFVKKVRDTAVQGGNSNVVAVCDHILAQEEKTHYKPNPIVPAVVSPPEVNMDTWKMEAVEKLISDPHLTMQADRQPELMKAIGGEDNVRQLEKERDVVSRQDKFYHRAEVLEHNYAQAIEHMRENGVDALGVRTMDRLTRAATERYGAAVAIGAHQAALGDSTLETTLGRLAAVEAKATDSANFLTNAAIVSAANYANPNADAAQKKDLNGKIALMEYVHLTDGMMPNESVRSQKIDDDVKRYQDSVRLQTSQLIHYEMEVFSKLAGGKIEDPVLAKQRDKFMYTVMDVKTSEYYSDMDAHQKRLRVMESVADLVPLGSYSVSPDLRKTANELFTDATVCLKILDRVQDLPKDYDLTKKKDQAEFTTFRAELMDELEEKSKVVDDTAKDAARVWTIERSTQGARGFKIEYRTPDGKKTPKDDAPPPKPPNTA